MILPLRVGLAEKSAQELANSLRRIRMGECFKDLYVEEFPVSRVDELPGGWGRTYRVTMEFHPIEKYPEEAGISWTDLESCFRNEFAPKFIAALKQELRRIERLESEDVISKVN